MDSSLLVFRRLTLLKLRKNSPITKVIEDENVGILVLQNADLETLPRRLQVIIENSVRPTIVTLGGQEAGLSLRERIKRSVGVDLWK